MTDQKVINTNTNPTELKTFYVKSMRLAGFLMQRGFVLHGVKPEINNSNRNIFLFTNSPQLLSAIEQYKQIKK